MIRKFGVEIDTEYSVDSTIQPNSGFISSRKYITTTPMFSHSPMF